MSVYSVNTWSSSTTYNIHDFVKYGDKYYYSLINGNNNNAPSDTSLYWGGVTSYNGQTKPKFIFKPSYNNSVSFTPAAKLIRFGDGYEQRVSDGIHNTLLGLNLIFDLRTETETSAINHFLKERKGVESFVYTPQVPFDYAKLFVCREWETTNIFFNNYTIQARFEEVVN
jgi:phage-related protein